MVGNSVETPGPAPTPGETPVAATPVQSTKLSLAACFNDVTETPLKSHDAEQHDQPWKDQPCFSQAPRTPVDSEWTGQDWWCASWSSLGQGWSDDCWRSRSWSGFDWDMAWSLDETMQYQNRRELPATWRVASTLVGTEMWPQHSRGSLRLGWSSTGPATQLTLKTRRLSQTQRRSPTSLQGRSPSRARHRSPASLQGRSPRNRASRKRSLSRALHRSPTASLQGRSPSRALHRSPSLQGRSPSRALHRSPASLQRRSLLLATLTLPQTRTGGGKPRMVHGQARMRFTCGFIVRSEATRLE